MAIAPRDYELRPRRVRILLISSVDLLLRATLACKYQLVWLDAFIMTFHYTPQVFIAYSKCMATDTVIEYIGTSSFLGTILAKQKTLESTVVRVGVVQMN